MDEIQNRLNKAVNDMLERIDRGKVHPLTKESYLRMAACYDKQGASGTDIQNCVQNTHRKMEAVQNIIQKEMGELQNRLERCSMGCQDEVKDKMAGKENNKANMEQAEKLALSCTTHCVDKHISLLKGIERTLESNITAVAKQF